MRCFISIDLPAETKKEIERIQQQLPKDAKYIFVKPEIVHLTLKFLGDIDEMKTEAVKAVMKKINFKKFKARLDGLSVFTPSFVKVVYLNIEPKDEFSKLHAVADKLISLENFELDREWESHATLARVKFLRDKRKFLDEISKIKTAPIEFIVDKLILKKSVLTEKGPIYEDLMSVKLG